MRFLLMLFGGVLGAAQTVIISEFVGKLAAAGWLLILVPAGALPGIVVASAMLHLGTDAKWNWREFFAVWLFSLSPAFGFSLFAPMLLIGMGPDLQNRAPMIFCIEYGVAWMALYGFCRLHTNSLKNN